MIVGLENSKYDVKFRFYESSKQKVDNINSIELSMLLKFPKLFKVEYSEDYPTSDYYIKIDTVFSSKINIINFKLFKIKNYGKTVKGTINIINIYKIDYCLPEKILNILSLFNELKEIFEKSKNLFFNNEIIFNIYLYKKFNNNHVENETELGITINNQSDNIEKIKEFIKNFINLTNKTLYIKINEDNYYIKLEKTSDNVLPLDFDKFEKIFQIFNLLNNLKKIKIINSSKLEIEFKNFMSIETTINKFIENFDNYINSINLLTSNFVQIILDYIEKRVDKIKREELLKIISKIALRFKNEFNEINNFTKLLKL